MSSVYPGALDSFSNPIPGGPGVGTQMTASPTHAQQHAAVNNAILAVQSTLGLNPQGDYDTVAERLDGELGDIAAALAAILEPEA